MKGYKVLKRKYSRKKILALVNLYHASLQSPAGTGCLVDLGLGGASVETQAEMENTQIVLMGIHVSGKKTLLLSGEILWKVNMPLKTFRYGIRFMNMTRGMRFKLFFFKLFPNRRSLRQKPPAHTYV